MTIKVPLAPRHAALVLRAVHALKPEELTADERDALPHVEARLIRAMGKHGASAPPTIRARARGR